MKYKIAFGYTIPVFVLFSAMPLELIAGVCKDGEHGGTIYVCTGLIGQ